MNQRSVYGLVAVVMVVALPRFNQRDWLIDSLTGTSDSNLADAGRYIAVAESIRGGAEQVDLWAPYVDRPLVPAVAAFLPFSVMTGINLINLVALAAATWAVVRSAEAAGATATQALWGGALFGISFPVFYYGAIGLVDPAVVAVAALALLATLRQRWWLVVLLLAAGLFIKESALAIAVPAVAFAAVSNGRRNVGRTAALAVVLATVGAVSFVVSRSLLEADRSASWSPTVQHLVDNMTRLRSLAAVALTLGVPTIVWIVASRRPIEMPHRWYPRSAAGAALAGGLLVSLAQLFVAFFTVFLDGRYVWPGVVYVCVAVAPHLGSRMSSVD